VLRGALQSPHLDLRIIGVVEVVHAYNGLPGL
jgi:hypothetical protein